MKGKANDSKGKIRETGQGNIMKAQAAHKL
jgi:hypothetical protein